MNVIIKYSIITLILGLCWADIFGQTEPKMLNYGITVGGTNDKPFKNKLYGFSAGAFVRYNINEMLGVSFEPKFIQREIGNFDLKKIYSANSPYHSNVVSADLQIGTIEIPLLLNVFFLNDNSFRPKVFCGFLYNYNLNARTLTKRTHKFDDKNFENIESYADATKRIKSFDFAAELGIGAEFKTDKIFFSLNLSYKLGLSGINNVENYPDFKSNICALTIGIGM